jgi:DNA-binding Lrp family transcriptional regulator
MDNIDIQILKAIEGLGNRSYYNIDEINKLLGIDLNGLRDRLEILENNGYVMTAGVTGGGAHSAGLTASGRQFLREMKNV